jgi:hypothetical protein
VEKAATGPVEKAAAGYSRGEDELRVAEDVVGRALWRGRKTGSCVGARWRCNEERRGGTIEYCREDEWTRGFYGQEDTMLGWCHGPRMAASGQSGGRV